MKTPWIALGLLVACGGEGPSVAVPADPSRDAGPPSDAGEPAPDAGPVGAPDGRDPPEPDPPPAPPDPPPPDVVDCRPLSGGALELCSSTDSECHVVFRDGSGCPSTCRVAGLRCLRSFADAPLGCGPLAGEPLDCRETGHTSDYCVCGRGDVGPTDPPPAPRPDGPRYAIPTPTFDEVRRIDRTIVIDAPGVYDYEGVLHEWTGPGDCNQTENQPYVLRIAASNVTLRNFAYRNAPDGIHIGTSSRGQGHSDGSPIHGIVLENVTGWACEDALTTQYGVQDVTIRDSLFMPNPEARYRDKLLQLNFGDITVERTTFYGGQGGTCLMFKGGQAIVVRDSLFHSCERAVNGSTQNGIVGRVSRDRSTLSSEGNEANYGGEARPFWDPWEFLTGDGDVHITSAGDRIFDGGRNHVDEGATLTVR